MADHRMVLEVLRSARALIEDPEDWCGDGVGTGRTRCAIRALVAAAPSCKSMRDHLAYQALSEAVGGPVGYFNDSHTHAEVIAAFDKAIASLEAEIAYNALQPELADPEPTPTADMTIEAILAIEECADVLTRQVVAQHPQMNYREVQSMVAAEIFYAAQDAAWALDMGVKVQRDGAPEAGSWS